MHFIDDTVMNVLTLGGHILFFKGMYEFCETDSEVLLLFRMKYRIMN